MSNPKVIKPAVTKEDAAATVGILKAQKHSNWSNIIDKALVELAKNNWVFYAHDEVLKVLSSDKTKVYTVTPGSCQCTGHINHDRCYHRAMLGMLIAASRGIGIKSA